MIQVALCQTNIAWEDKGKNLSRAAEVARQAAVKGALLTLFPEMTLTGFSMNISKTAEPYGHTIEKFASIAMDNGIAVGFGWTEACGDMAKNHYTVVSAKGDVLSDYVKLHPFSYGGEDKYFLPGSKIVSFNLQGINAAPFVCYDLRFPEVFQAASVNAHLLIVAANWPAARSSHWRALLVARAIENQSFVAGINCVGDVGPHNYSGGSMLVDPAGRIVEEIEGREGIIIAAIDTSSVERYRKAFPVKADRKADFYKTIL